MRSRADGAPPATAGRHTHEHPTWAHRIPKVIDALFHTEAGLTVPVVPYSVGRVGGLGGGAGDAPNS